MTGLAATIWFLVRVVPKPDRAAYPCQRAAFPLASGFVAWLLGMAGAVVAFRKARERARHARYAVAVVCVALGLLAGGLTFVAQPFGTVEAFSLDPLEGPNNPVGVGRGVRPGRVVWVHDPDATNEDWDADDPGTGYWWEDHNTDLDVVREMLSKGLRWLADADTDQQAWDRLFRHVNQNRFGTDAGYAAGQKICVKLNLNTETLYADESNEADVAPQLVYALLEQLVDVVGADPADITFYDSIKNVADKIYVRCVAAYPGVRFVDREGGSGRILVDPSDSPVLFYAGGAGSDCLPESVIEAAYCINFAMLKKHQLGGFTACAKNYFGSVCRIPYSGSSSPYNLHGDLPSDKTGYAQYRSLVDLVGHEHTGGKTVLYLVDGLWGGWYSHGSRSTPTKWTKVDPFIGDYPSSVFLSQDPVAIDSVALDFVRHEDQKTSGDGSLSVRNYADDYLHEAAQANSPDPTWALGYSGTSYDPENDGTGLTSLGVHEHWDDAATKRYTRNLDPFGGQGIELYTGPTPGDTDRDYDVDATDLATTGVNWSPSPAGKHWGDGDFDGDGDVDAVDLAALGLHWDPSGTGAAPVGLAAAGGGSGDMPRLVSTSPALGSVTAGLSAVGIQFDRDVEIGGGAVEVHARAGGAVGGRAVSYDAASRTLWVTWSSALPADTYEVRVLADAVLGADGGAKLDGDVGIATDPTSLPSGDGVPGGDSILEFHAE